MAHVDAPQEGLIAPRRCLFQSPLHPLGSAIGFDHSFNLFEIDRLFAFPLHPQPHSWPCGSLLAPHLPPSFVPAVHEDTPHSHVQWEACCCHQPVKATPSSNGHSKSEVKKGYRTHDMFVFKIFCIRNHVLIFCMHRASRGSWAEPANHLAADRRCFEKILG